MTKTVKLPGTPVQSIPTAKKAKVAKAKLIKVEKPVIYIPAKVVDTSGDILTTGVTVENMEVAIDHLYEFTTRANPSYNYAMVMEEDDGSLTLVERVKMPCWGAIREYHCGSRPFDQWPDDLMNARHIFPKTGKPVTISFQFKYYGNVKKDAWNKFITEFAFNAQVSPWRSILKDFELTIKDDLIVGVVFKDTKIDPTVLVSLMRNCGGMDNGVYSRMTYNKNLAITYLTLKQDYYGFSPRICIDRFVDGNPFDFSNGKTFYERESYNRPDIDYVFGGKANIGDVFQYKNYDTLLELYNKSKQEAA